METAGGVNKACHKCSILPCRLPIKFALSGKPRIIVYGFATQNYYERIFFVS
ncbi:hypothetical protein TPE_0929 [Treponema pedis str. T A4]|uniref:Uncharacterized protein n=1 Tax=Treponema pedis str. T A4 TaxID=1291379 RepID=S5ZTF1_9SPIR|nr:hypothetical protein TPE_0929 [Treponema pedis str. T A4]